MRRLGVNFVPGTPTSHASVLHADGQIPTHLRDQVLVPMTQVKKQSKTRRLSRTASIRASLALAKPIRFRLEGHYGGAAERSAKKCCLAEQPSIVPQGLIDSGVNASEHPSKLQ